MTRSRHYGRTLMDTVAAAITVLAKVAAVALSSVPPHRWKTPPNQGHIVPPDVVYHYTTASGLLGIIQHRKLWMTDIEFMNDAVELTYARPVVLDSLRDRADQIAPPGEDSAEGMRADTLRNAAGELEPASQNYHVYATCFCEKGDLLSQWRAYGGDGGYAIGFRTEWLLEASASDDWIHFAKVIYGIDAARLHLDTMLNVMAKPVAGFPGATGNVRLMEHVLPTVATIKHPTFAEEQEWRLLSTSAGGGRPQFRTASVGLVPYVDIAFPENAVAQVIVGPGQHPEVRITAVRQLLESHGMSRFQAGYRLISGVDVVGSRSPLRL
jgi:Protein of unknown function (DUF2971)